LRTAKPVTAPAMGLVQTVAALGLGEITLSSRLNQPLLARISLVGVQAEDLANLQVRLGSAKLFEVVGLPRPHFLTGLMFAVKEDDEGEGDAYVEIRSRDSMREPAVSFVVDALWQKGRVIREYHLLLAVPNP